MDNNLIYQIAVTMLPGIGNVYARHLVTHFGTAEAVLKAKKKDLLLIEGIGHRRIEGILNFDLNKIEREISFIEKHRIQPLFFMNPDYPKRLLHCFDSPIMLYYKGNANLNASRIVAIVGTRNPSDYGRIACESLVKGLVSENIIIISGLAFGVDTIAHKAALNNNIETVGVLAHGLDRIYPPENKGIAKQMVKAGGLLTEFRHETTPDRQNFPIRNRIVAGMCDCVVVIESGLKGGSLITAELGNGYNRDVFAIPGRVNDPKSAGCNYLIKANKAGLITSSDDLLFSMGWKKSGKEKKIKPKELFIELSEDEKILYNILKEGASHIDNLYFKSSLSGSAAVQALISLEMQGIISSLPGKMYALS